MVNIAEKRESTFFVAASDADAQTKKRADFVCDGIADDVEIQAAIDALPGEGGTMLLRDKFQGQEWFSDAKSYWAAQFPSIEERLRAVSRCVALHRDNRETYSVELATLLKEAGSIFDSVLRALVKGAGSAPKRRDHHDIHDFCNFLRMEVPDIHKRSLAIRPCLPAGVVVPFKGLDAQDGVPGWWRAYNKVKHEGSANFPQGNLENSVTAVCALALLGNLMGAFVSDPVFVNVGIAYKEGSIDLSAERLLFPDEA